MGFIRERIKPTHRLRILEVTFFALLAMLILNTIFLHPSTHVLGAESDYTHFHWNFWWMRHAIFDLHQDIYTTDYLHVPFQQDLAFHTLTAVWLPIYIALEPIVGQILTVNIIIWLNLVLSGYITYLFLKSEAIPRDLALIIASWIIISPYMVNRLTEFHLNMLAFFWLPATALLWKQIVQRKTIISAIALGFAIWLAWLTDPQWLLWMPFILIPYGIKTLINAPSERVKLIALGLLSLVITFALAYLIAPLRQQLGFDGIVPPATYENTHHLSLPFEGLWRTVRTTVSDSTTNLGLLLLPLTIIALFMPNKNHSRWMWLCVGIIGMTLALGTDIHINNQTIAMPYRALHDLLNGFFRTPIRFVVIGYFGVLMFIALSLKPILPRLPRPTRTLVIIALFLTLIADQRMNRPLSTYDIPDYNFYDTIADDPADVVVLELPISIANGWNHIGRLRPHDQYYGVIHGKRMINGFIAREHSYNYLFYEQSPLWNWFAGNIGMGTYEPLREEFASAIEAWDIGYIVVIQAELGADFREAQNYISFLNQLPETCYWLTEGERVVYRTHISDCTTPSSDTIDLGTPTDRGNLGVGWYYPESFGGQSTRWMGDSAQLHLQPTHNAGELTFSATAFHESRTVHVYLEDTQLGTITVNVGDWQTFTLPFTNITPDTQHTLRFESDTSHSPSDVLDSADTRQLSIAVSNIRVE